MIDPRTKRPVYRGFRSIDLLNCMSALEKAQQIQRRAQGLSNDVGMAQLSEAIKNSKQINVTVENMTVEAKPKSKMEAIIDALEYEDIAVLIKERRAMKRNDQKDIIEVDYTQDKDDK